jgi:uncharacterized membrane protein YedE/YeeE
MTVTMKQDSRSVLIAIVSAAAAGVLFGVGLGISGMARPMKVLAFLDVTGAWDPSLAFVMMGAIGVHALAVVVAKRRERTALGGIFHWPKPAKVDKPLLVGAAVFGLGWGLGGFCPGPALLGAASGNAAAIVFVVAMVGGMIARHTSARREAALAAGTS